MTFYALDPDTRSTLADLDPAPAALDSTQQDRAEATLLGILAAGPAPDGQSAEVGTPRRRRRITLGVVASAAAVTVGIQLLGGGDSAYATWTATPHRPTTPEQLAATDECRGTIVDGLSDPEGRTTPGPTRNDVLRAPVALAEQRGDWTLVILDDGERFDATCITGPEGGGGFTSAGFSTQRVTVGPRDVRLTAGGGGGDPDRAVTTVVGVVGSEVRGVVIHTAARGPVTATVAGGHLAAWWPDPYEPGTIPSPGMTPKATITYSDGTSEVRVLDGGA